MDLSTATAPRPTIIIRDLRDSPSVAQRLGFWSAVVAAVASVAFPIGLVLATVFFPEPAWNGSIRSYAAGYRAGAMLLTVVPSLLIMPGFIGLVVAIHSTAQPRYRPLTLLALAFAILYGATVGINYFLELSTVRTSLTSGTNLTAIAPFAMADFNGFFWSLESIGYGWQGMAALLLAFTFGSGRVERWIRSAFIAIGVSGLIGIVGGATGRLGTVIVMAGGGAIWLLAFPVATALCAVYYRAPSLEARLSS